MALQPGQIIAARYRVVRTLGQGGYGAVYLVEDTRLVGRTVALKESFDNSADANAQFELEATILANIHHPSLPAVSDYFSEGSTHHFLVMDFVEGQDLSDIIEQGSVPEQQAVSWLIEICDAVAFLHAHNPPIIHRDIKPHNIKIRRDGHAVLVDFGIAKLYNPRKQTARIAKAISSGFSPPEQYGAGTNTYSDVYALGATLYCTLTRRVPPEGLELVTKKAQLIPPRQLNPQVSPPVEQVILKAMSLNSLARYPTARELGDALRVALSGQPAAVAPSAPGVRCPRCGYMNRANAKFCQRDGTRLGVAPAPVPAAPAMASISPEMHFEAGNQCARRKDFQAAVSEYAEAARSGFEHVALYYNWADALIELGRAAEAISILQRGLARYSQDGDLYAELGLAYALNGQDTQAAQILQRAITLNPQPSAHLLLGLVYQKLGQEAQAIPEVRAYLAVEPDSAFAHQTLGELFLKTNQLAPAQAEFERVLQLEPQNVGGHLYLGIVHLRAKRFNDAIRWGQKVLRLAPDNALAYYFIGQAYLEQKKWKEALSSFQESARLDPHDPDPHFQMAACYSQLNRRSEVIRELNQVLQIDPGNQRARDLLNKV